MASLTRKISSARSHDIMLASSRQISAGSARKGGCGAGRRVPRPTGEGYLVNSEGVARLAHTGHVFAINELREL